MLVVQFDKSCTHIQNHTLQYFSILQYRILLSLVRYRGTLPVNQLTNR